MSVSLGIVLGCLMYNVHGVLYWNVHDQLYFIGITCNLKVCYVFRILDVD